jgi:hypothetical protein
MKGRGFADPATKLGALVIPALNPLLLRKQEHREPFRQDMAPQTKECRMG